MNIFDAKKNEELEQRIKILEEKFIILEKIQITLATILKDIEKNN